MRMFFRWIHQGSINVSWMHRIVCLDDVSKYISKVKSKGAKSKGAKSKDSKDAKSKDAKDTKKVSHKIGDVWNFDNYGNLIRSKIDATNDSPGSVTHHEDCNMNSIFLYDIQCHERFAVHKSCWLVCNKPTPEDLLGLKTPDFGYKDYRYNTYQNQDFNMNGFVADNPDKFWMLEDPLTNEKNKIRVLSHYHKFK